MGKAERRSVNTSEEDDDKEMASSSSGRSREARVRKSGNSPSRSTKSSSSSSSKKKKSNTFNKVVIGTNKIAPSIDVFGLAAELKANPVKTGKRLAFKAMLYGIVVFLFLSVLNMAGVSIPGSRSLRGLTSSSGTVVISAVDEDGNAVDPDAEVAGGEEPEAAEAIPEMQNYAEKKSGKIDKAKEKILACEEVDCENSCNKKTAPKCIAKKACRTDREKLCKRRCRKARCEERCKDEPKYGYVEREQKMDKCKEGCQGSTAQHNKCIKKCHSEFKPCKSRCNEISSKYKCDTKTVIGLAPQADSSASAKGSQHSDPRDKGNSDNEDDDVGLNGDDNEDGKGAAGGADLDDEVI
mmetsp:Transcript_7486/g.13032  ORF Transcript_7486/g.13032 Transcript_7486/m.13032 type:complete len:353 (-) Transcript_7486:137-1195(-)